MTDKKSFEINGNHVNFQNQNHVAAVLSDSDIILSKAENVAVSETLCNCGSKAPEANCGSGGLDKAENHISEQKNRETTEKYSKLYDKCRLCPFCCQVNRNAGIKGRCGAPSGIRVSNIQKHEWEEPCLSGQGLETPVKGSGTVFFTHCPLGCVFCQNRQISRRSTSLGREMSADVLASEFLRLQQSGVHNINLVTPTHFVPGIIEALLIAKSKGLTVPVVYNSSGYESEETLQLLSGLIDIYLPDYKYFSSHLSELYSVVPDYQEKCEAALKVMQKQTGKPLFDENGIMKRGTIVRHLVLPGCDYDSLKVVSRLHLLFGKEGIVLSLMSQYTPTGNLPFPELNEKLPYSAYLRVVASAQKYKFRYLYTQSGESAAESFIPVFI